MKQVTIYTDGACSGNPGEGGWGCVLIYGNNRKELSGYTENTTNNRMEITAAIRALAALKEPCAISLYTDSAYLCNAFTKGWLNHWRNNEWKKADHKPVENIDLWQELLMLTSVHDVSFLKTKGHADDALNNRCDELARSAISDHRRLLPNQTELS